MTDDKDDVVKSLERLNEELKAFKNVNETIEEIYVKSKENKIEDRKFQLQMFEVQRGYDDMTL